MKKIFEKEFFGKKFIVEYGELAKQANGAVLVRVNDTVVLSTTCVSNNANLLSDFFPLMVGALVVQMGVSTTRSTRGRSRVAS